MVKTLQCPCVSYRVKLLRSRWTDLLSLLRWLTTVFRRLKSARYDFLPVVNNARADKNRASNSKKAQTSFSTFIALNRFEIFAYFQKCVIT